MRERETKEIFKERFGKVSRIERRFNEGKPKQWNTSFATKVIDAYKDGELTKNNIEEWEKDYNGGEVPNPPFATKKILDYHIKTKEDPR